MNTRSIVLTSLLTLPALHGAAGAERPVTYDAVPASALWESTTSIRQQDLFNGPWGAANAPDPRATYTFLGRKHGGVSPGLVVQDPRGRIWHVKQAIGGSRGDEGPVEVTLSRLLSAIGYHQPPVYFLPAFRLTDGSKTSIEPGGRFRLADPSVRANGTWAWENNPFVGTRPYDGLLAILLMFNSWDLKDSNNSIYDVRRGGRVDTWYVVRDLGGALGESGTVSPKRNDVGKFERQDYVRGFDHGYIKFDYRGKRPELVHHRISVDDLRWASDLLGQLDERQWRDAFRAGGYDADVSTRFIRKIRANMVEGLQTAQARGFDQERR